MLDFLKKKTEINTTQIVDEIELAVYEHGYLGNTEKARDGNSDWCYGKTDTGNFQEKILPFLKPGGVALFGVSGIREEFDTQTEALLSPWLGEEAYMFHSPRQWRGILGTHPDMEFVEVTELSCFEAAWLDWLATENEYAKGDAGFWDTMIIPYTNFVCMVVKKKSK